MRTFKKVGEYRAGEEWVVWMPYQTLKTPRRAVAFRNGYTSTAEGDSFPGSLDDWAMHLPTTKFDCDWGASGGSKSFGNDDSVTAGNAIFSRITSGAYPQCKTDKVILGAVSMGGGVVLNWARQNPTKVAAILLDIPLLDLQYVHDTAPSQSQNGQTVSGVYPTLVADIEASAGGVANLTDVYYQTHSPIRYASQLAGIPIFLFYSPNDVVTNGGVVAPQFAAAQGSTTLIEGLASPGLGHAYTPVGTEATQQACAELIRPYI